mmetsp:Transcript_32295/g.47974  ORF Transcript_32295/g.47974 Transcript_32295/m.47974 type:complete len:82 (+) Transcript_32295:232-477(+)
MIQEEGWEQTGHGNKRRTTTTMTTTMAPESDGVEGDGSLPMTYATRCFGRRSKVYTCYDLCAGKISSSSGETLVSRGVCGA